MPIYNKGSIDLFERGAQFVNVMVLSLSSPLLWEQRPWHLVFCLLTPTHSVLITTLPCCGPQLGSTEGEASLHSTLLRLPGYPGFQVLLKLPVSADALLVTDAGFHTFFDEYLNEYLMSIWCFPESSWAQFTISNPLFFLLCAFDVSYPFLY